MKASRRRVDLTVRSSLEHVRVHHVVVVACAFMLYFTGFVTLLLMTGTSVGSYLTLLPVIASSWAFGFLGSLGAPLIIFLVHSVLLGYLSNTGIMTPFLSDSARLGGYAGLFVIGILTAWISTLYRRLSSILKERGEMQDLSAFCISCKRAADSAGSWHEIESMVPAVKEGWAVRTICPTCRWTVFDETVAPHVPSSAAADVNDPDSVSHILLELKRNLRTPDWNRTKRILEWLKLEDVIGYLELIGWEYEESAALLDDDENRTHHTASFTRTDWHGIQCQKVAFSAHTDQPDRKPAAIREAARIAIMAWALYRHKVPFQKEDGELDVLPEDDQPVTYSN